MVSKIVITSLNNRGDMTYYAACREYRISTSGKSAAEAAIRLIIQYPAYFRIAIGDETGGNPRYLPDARAQRLIIVKLVLGTKPELRYRAMNMPDNHCFANGQDIEHAVYSLIAADPSLGIRFVVGTIDERRKTPLATIPIRRRRPTPIASAGRRRTRTR